MKKTKFSSIILLLTLSLIACEERRSIFAEKIRSYVQERTNPVKANELVYDIQNKLTILSYTLSLKELEEVKTKYDLSDSLIMQIRAAPFVRTSGVKKIEEKLQNNFFTYEESLGAALKENDGKISFALIKTKSFAKLKAQYEKYPSRECHRVWIFFKKCHDVEHQRERELKENEKIIINEATKYSSIKSILRAVDILKRGDYELYMSETGNIFSPDHKSVAHVTYFGNIAIGPTSELNSILPINYEYKFKSNGSNAGGYLTRNVKDDDVINLGNYPSNGFRSIMKNGKYFKFNYLRKDKKPSTFPTKFIDLVSTESLNGPYVLEVKKNGNVILYSKKDPNIILWTTNTANKGKGPYNFHLTNDKKLILEDSTGKILYQSPDYKEIPTIYYSGTSNKNLQNVYNGQLANKDFNTTIDKKELRIQTDATNYDYSIVGREKIFNTNNPNYYGNPNFDPTFFRNSILIDLLRVYNTFTDNDDVFDICYTVYFNHFGWSSFYCNGEIAGNEVSESQEQNYNFITNFIIYIKEKEEPLPDFLLPPKYIPTQADLSGL